MRQLGGESAKRELVPQRSQPADHAHGRWREHGMPSLGLARINVRDVDLDEGNPDAGQCVANGETRVAIGPSIYDHACGVIMNALYVLDELPLSVPLHELE